MHNELAMAGGGSATPHSLRLRLPAVFVALALVFTALFLVQHKSADASPAAVAAVVVPAGVAPQINFAQFVCPILLSIRASFASSPFFAIVVAALNPILIAFGCVPSTG